MNENLYITLGLNSKASFPYADHLQGRLNAGYLRTLKFQNTDWGGTQLRIVVAKEGMEWVGTVVHAGTRVDLNMHPVGEVATIGQTKALIEAIQPLWAGVEDTSELKFPCSQDSGGWHIFSLPAFQGQSFWGRNYCQLFAGKLLELRKCSFCRIDEVADGLWVEIDHSNLEDLKRKRKKLEDYLLPDGPWGLEGRTTHAVLEALLNGLSFEAAVMDMTHWRDVHREFAMCNMDEILKTLKKEVRRYGRRRRDHDVCSAWGDLEGTLFGWSEQPVQMTEQSLRGTALSHRVKWAAILYDFVKVPFRRGFKTHAQCVLYNSCMKEVSVCDLEV